MSRHRTHRADTNQASIIDALRAVGVHVAVTSQVGEGYPDLTCSRAGRVYWLEVKRPGEQLSPAERAFAERAGGLVATVHDVSEALAACGIEVQPC